MTVNLLIGAKTYNLKDFIETHPGGSEVIKRAVAMSSAGYDVEPLIHMYHPTHLWPTIKKQLENYRVADTLVPKRADGAQPAEYDYSEYGKIKAFIEADPQIPHKATRSYWATVGFQTILTVSLYILAYLSTGYLGVVMCGLIGISETGLMFNVLHDSSHYAIFKNPKHNEFMAMISNAWANWNSLVWHNHHFHIHHSFTGDYDLDIDTHNYAITDLLPRWLGILFRTLLLIVFPGQNGVQILYYLLTNRFSVRVEWHHPLHYIIASLKIVVYYTLGIKALALIGSLNLMYWINIIGDHDQHETLEANYKGTNWLIRQIRNSGDFIRSNSLWTRWFGGINHQIAHHLFPNYTNVSLPKISERIRHFKFSEDLAFVEADSMLALLKSHFARSALHYSKKSKIAEILKNFWRFKNVE